MGIGPELLDWISGSVVPLMRKPFSVCELGNQMIHGDVKGGERVPAESWYRANGASHYDCIDTNGAGTIHHDLNLPLLKPDEVTDETSLIEAPYDLVTDFGTSEHVFDFAQVWRTVHKLTRTPGGLIVFEKLCEGVEDHGFYNVQGCLWRDLAKANRYHVHHLERIVVGKSIRWRGLFERLYPFPFINPQQGRYQ